MAALTGHCTSRRASGIPAARDATALKLGLHAQIFLCAMIVTIALIRHRIA